MGVVTGGSREVSNSLVHKSPVEESACHGRSKINALEPAGWHFNRDDAKLGNSVIFDDQSKLSSPESLTNSRKSVCENIKTIKFESKIGFFFFYW